MAGFRLYLGLILNNLAIWIKMLIPALLRQEDLIEFNRKTYQRISSICYFSSDKLLEGGLFPWEERLLKEANLKGKRILVLFCGAGRECVWLAKQGYEVTGIDFIPENIKFAQKYAEIKKLKIEYLVGEITQLNLPPLSYDVGIAFFFMYGTIPNQNRRTKLLKQIYESLAPKGIFVFDFSYHPVSRKLALVGYKINKILSFVSCGNLQYQLGDVIKDGGEFYHFFQSEKEVYEEAEEAGFKVERIIRYPQQPNAAGVILKKKRR